MRQFMEGGPGTETKQQQAKADVSVGAPINVKHMQHFTPSDMTTLSRNNSH